MRTASWDEIEEFCKRDGWEHVRSADHEFYRKVLPDGRVLETHVSFSSNKSMSPGRFMSILRTQLKVSQQDFWETLRTGRSAARPGEPLPEPAQHEGWVIQVLIGQVGLTPAEIEHLPPDKAKQLVFDYWSRAKK